MSLPASPIRKASFRLPGASAARQSGVWCSRTPPTGLATGQASGAQVVALATSLGPEDLHDHNFVPDLSGITYTAERGGQLVFTA